MRQPNHGRTIAAPSQTTARLTLPTMLSESDPPGPWLAPPASDELAAASAFGVARPSRSPCALPAPDASRASVALPRDDVRSRADLKTQARQPARIRSYCDLGMNRDEGFMIWNHALYVFRASPVMRRGPWSADSPR